MTYPENQCPGCGSLPDDTEDRVPCDFCGFGVDDLRTNSRANVSAALGERAIWLLLFCACSYFFFQICRWAMIGFRIVGVS